MKELSWPERGRLWLRLGLRLLLWCGGLWAAVRLGPPLVSLFAPFLLAFFVAWGLSPVVRWLYARFRLPRQVAVLALLFLVFAAFAALLWPWWALPRERSLSWPWTGRSCWRPFRP